MVFDSTGLVLGSAVAVLLFLAQLRWDFRKFNGQVSALAALIERFVPFLDRKMAMDAYQPVDRMEGQLLSYIDSKHKDIRAQFIEGRTVSLFEFDEVWRLLLEEFFTSRSEGVLRDVTFSSHGDTSLQMYDFTKYPLLVREYIVRHRNKNNEVRFLIVCSPSAGVEGVNNRLAEGFLRQLLEIKYPRVIETEKLLERWADDDEETRAPVKIMISNESIVKRVVGHAEFSCPFNVYGDLAVSRSVVKGDALESKLPHIEVSVKRDEVEKSARLFDSVWSESRQFKKVSLLGMTVDQKRTFGRGEVFALWSGQS